MLITVLGKSPAWPDAGGACSGYLVQDDGHSLLLDCGNGVLAKLRQHLDYVDLDSILVTHLHADHYLDLIPYAYALTYAPRQQPVPVGGWPGTDSPARPVLYAPPGAAEAFRHIVSTWGDAELIERAFQLREYRPADELGIGPLTARFCEVPHYTRTFAVELTGREGRRMTFGADCRPNDELVQFAHQTDLFLLEGTLPRPERSGDRGHLTPGEAGDHARRAQARRLVVTHYSDELDPEWVRAEAAEAYGGPVELAQDGAVYTV
ncbi:MAG TPA: MBL fold metallo-hydrolase [Solirubrobacteraceae bacterium]|nr:MBL fold metallo-hydrolase [Solirubrobacteraceae bacterium]